MRLFLLSLIGTVYLPNSISPWEQLEHKFHEHFFYGHNEHKLPYLTLVKLMHDESVNDYIRRFCDTKNQCFSVNITEKDLADLAFIGLCSHIKERLEDYDLSIVTQVHQRA